MLRVQPTSLDFPSDVAGRAFDFSWAGQTRTMFLAVRTRDAEFLSDRPDAILPYAAIFAFVHGLDLDLGGMPVDPVLLRNARCALAEASRWNGGRRAPRIVNAADAPVPPLNDGEAGVFYSGGIDSHFSLLRHLDGPDAGQDNVRPFRPVSQAVHLYHSDAPQGAQAFDTLGALEAAAAQWGLGFVPVQSNVMVMDRDFHDRWMDLGFGATLSSLMHLLSGRLASGIIASSHCWGGLRDSSSSPAIDPLWSGRRMEIVHDDARYSRTEKTELVARHPEALRSLNVCDIRIDGQGYVNCSRCPKCLRTMLTLDLFGAGGAERAPTFDWSAYTPHAFSRVFLRTASDRGFAEEILERARDRGRDDIAEACALALRRGRALRPVALAEDAVKNSAIGRRYRGPLKALRERGYRAVGLATKAPALRS